MTDLNSTILSAKQNNQHILAFLLDKNNPNELLNKIFTSIPITNILKNKNSISVVINFGTVDYTNFCNFYNETPKGKQALVLIAPDGLIKDYVNEDDEKVLNVGVFSVRMFEKLKNVEVSTAKNPEASEQVEQASSPKE